MRIRLLLLSLLVLAAAPGSALADSWTTVGPMTTGRDQHTATLLPNGQVLVAGGNPSYVFFGATDTSERYDPASGRWLATPSFVGERYRQAASLLPDGRVLMTGGYFAAYPNATPAVLSSVLAYDPATNRWRSAADLPHPHGFHDQVTLPDGRVLVFGGYGSTADAGADKADDQVELYDPATNAWTVGTTSPYFMANGTTTLLKDGSVLVAGGSSSNTNRNVAMRYFPATNRWRTAGSFADARRWQTATLLPNGKVLIAGGYGDAGRPLRTASLYDPATNSWSETVPMGTARANATATLLPNGKVLVVGGYSASESTASAELFDPATNAWSPTASMVTSRAKHTATLLADGRVLVAGGAGRDPGDVTTRSALPSAEIYTPDGWPFPRGGGGGGGGTSGTPSISTLALSATRFRAAGSGPSITTARRRRPPIGTTISWSDGAAATATFVVQRPAAGRASGGRCVRATRANRRHRRCTRWVAAGRFTHADAAGANSLRFSGRIRGHKLATGRYRLSVTARVGHGTPSAAHTVGFRIVR